MLSLPTVPIAGFVEKASNFRPWARFPSPGTKDNMARLHNVAIDGFVGKASHFRPVARITSPVDTEDSWVELYIIHPPPTCCRFDNVAALLWPRLLRMYIRVRCIARRT